MESAKDIAGRVRRGQLTATEVLKTCLARLKEEDPNLHAFVEVNNAAALENAAQIDRKIERGEPAGILGGVPVAIKSNICAKGFRTSCCSKILENYIPPYDAHAVRRLKEEGAVIIGSTNMDEFAMGSSCENSAFFPTLNPFEPSRVAGGSSGGSAAAVASRMVPLALGTDTGGSIRLPASFCGIVGLKPTYGLVSRYGLVAFASSLDQIGPLAGSVEDAFMLLSVIAGKDKRDSTSLEIPADFFKFLSLRRSEILGRAMRYKIGVVSDALLEGCDKEVHDLFKRAIETISSQGVNIETISLKSLPYAVACYYIISPAETSSNLARYDGVRYGMRIEGPSMDNMIRLTRREGFGLEVKRRIMIGTYALRHGYVDQYYVKAQKVRTIIKSEFDEYFKKFDIIMLPTAPSGPFRLGEKIDDPLAMYLSDAYTTPASLAGLPAISIPCSRPLAGLPVGLQLMAPALGEEKLYCASMLLESIMRRPEETEAS